MAFQIGRECNELCDPAAEEKINGDEQRPGSCLGQPRKGCVYFTFSAGGEYLNFRPDGADRDQHVSLHLLGD